MPSLTERADNQAMRRALATTAAAAVIGTLALVQGGAAGPGSLGAFFFGPKLVRAEVVLADGSGVHDYRVDRGRIRGIVRATMSLTLLERDGTLVTVAVSPSANITLGGASVPFTRLRRGFTATTVRDGDTAASIVQATR